MVFFWCVLLVLSLYLAFFNFKDKSYWFLALNMLTVVLCVYDMF